jgi:hypothetical protein
MNVKTHLLKFLGFVLLGISSLSAQPSLFFNIDNERTVTHPTLGSAYAFDVSMHASYNGTYHSRGLLYIVYDTTKFGSSVDFKNNIAVEHATLMQGTVNFFGQIRPKYVTVNVIDNRDSIVAITWESEWLGFLPNPALHNEVPDSLTKLYTLYLKIVSPPAPGDVDVYIPLMANQQYFITDVDGDGNPDEVPYGNISTLPIELLDFHAEWQADETVSLSWATLTETNNDFFVIEKRHENGTFFPIGQVDGAGNSQEIKTYQWTDRSEHSARNYYRLRQVDINGSSSYSDVIQLEVENKSLLNLYPSPTRDFVYLHSVIDESKTIIISDITGKLLGQKYFHFTETQTTFQLDLTTYADGVYFIQIIDEHGTSQSHKIIKSQH